MGVRVKLLVIYHLIIEIKCIYYLFFLQLFHVKCPLKGKIKKMIKNKPVISDIV